MQELLHPEQERSSLGISEALEDAKIKEQERLKTKPAISDAKFKVPSEKSTIFSWIRFYISLYYNKVSVNMFGFITGYKWYNRIDKHVILGALPTPSQIKSLHTHENVNTIVNLCAEFPGYESLYKELDITQIRLETPDFTVPSLDTIHTGISSIVQRIQQNPSNTIYLHCKAGKGRSAAIALCYLVRSYNLSLKESQTILLDKRVQVDKDIYLQDEIRAYYKDLLADMESGKYQRLPYDQSE